MVQYAGIKTNKSTLIPSAWIGENKQLGGIMFNSRKPIQKPFYLRVYLKYKAADSEIDDSINSGENRGGLLDLLFYIYISQGLHKKKKKNPAQDSHSEVSTGNILV